MVRMVFNFCFMADDAAGLSSERRCISLSVGSSVPTTPDVLAPAENSTLSITASGTIVTCRGSSSNGPIVQFKQTVPTAPITEMSCGNIVNDELNCNFTPSAAQFGTSIGYCFTAIDSVGAESVVRCFSMEIQDPPPPVILVPAANSTLSITTSGTVVTCRASSSNGQIVQLDNPFVWTIL